jgi:cyclopropane-fatty-acyl-phospholipid synthase
MIRLALRQIFRVIGSKSSDTALHVKFADGSTFRTNPSDERSKVLIRFRNRRGELHSLLYFYEGLFESFVSGDVDIEGDEPIGTLARLGYAAGQASAPWLRDLGNPLIDIRKRVQEWRQSGACREQAIRNAEFHYGLPSKLFKAMLGETLGYSEGLWAPGTTTLNQAKYNLYEYICRKLQLKSGMTVLEVGAGWGYMPIYMARRYNVEVTVYNPVPSQNDYMRKRFHRHELSEKIRLVQGDHRDIAREGERFDRFVSIGVHEHAGYRLKQYRLWAESIAAGLKDGGVGIVSTTTWMIRRMTGLLTLKYIFPGGHIPSLPDTLAAFNRAGLTLLEVENLWPHYKRTISEWRTNFINAWPEIHKSDPSLFTEAFRRQWIMYLEATAATFEDSLDLSHIVFTKGRNEESCRSFLGSGEVDPIGGDHGPDPYA